VLQSQFVPHRKHFVDHCERSDIVSVSMHSVAFNQYLKVAMRFSKQSKYVAVCPRTDGRI